MKYNLKNRPKWQTYALNQKEPFTDYVDKWFEGFEAELREKLEGNKPYGPSPMTKELIKEILGE